MQSKIYWKKKFCSAYVHRWTLALIHKHSWERVIHLNLDVNKSFHWIWIKFSEREKAGDELETSTEFFWGCVDSNYTFSSAFSLASSSVSMVAFPLPHWLNNELNSLNNAISMRFWCDLMKWKSTGKWTSWKLACNNWKFYKIKIKIQKEWRRALFTTNVSFYYDSWTIEYVSNWFVCVWTIFRTNSVVRISTTVMQWALSNAEWVEICCIN